MSSILPRTNCPSRHRVLTPISAISAGELVLRKRRQEARQTVRVLNSVFWIRSSTLTYARPRDFMCPFDLRSPILDAFFFTVSVDRPSLAAISAVAWFGNSLVRVLVSAFDHTPLTSFFFAMAQLLSSSLCQFKIVACQLPIVN